MSRLVGAKVAFLTSMTGIEDPELTVPWTAVLEAGGAAELVAPEPGEVSTVSGDLEPVASYPVDRQLDAVVAAEFDALVIPGGTVNADRLRVLPAAQALVRAFAEQRKPIAAICHGPWLLIDAGVADGATLTSYHSLATDLRNAGATWVDAEVSVWQEQGWPLVTSRQPDDLPAFCTMLVDVVGEAVRT